MIIICFMWAHGMHQCSACREAVHAAEDALAKESLDDLDLEVDVPLRGFSGLKVGMWCPQFPLKRSLLPTTSVPWMDYF